MPFDAPCLGLVPVLLFLPFSRTSWEDRCMLPVGRRNVTDTGVYTVTIRIFRSSDCPSSFDVESVGFGR